ncbi:MAG: hypothetical protein HY904_22485 [Deltaproteobacteria bacterium]|nr:hypothetical protein [Deltaproteobacteria bacterium]
MSALAHHPRNIRTTLVNLAFAGAALALAVRGVVLILSAPGLAALVGESATGAAARSVPRGTEKPRAWVPFPALAPEKQEVITPLTDGPDLSSAVPKAPFVPLNGVSVVGITWFTEPTFSLAAIVYNAERNIHSVNDCEWVTLTDPEGIQKKVPMSPCNQVAEGYLIREIRRFRVRLEHVASGEMQDLDLYGDGKPVVALAMPPPAGPAAPAGDTKGKGSAISKMMDNVKQLGPNHWEAPAGMREEVLGRLSEVAMEGRWLPYFENGKITGFKLAQTVPNSAFDKIGLKSGDVIKSVNGYDISSPDKMLDVFTKLRDARDINVDVQRGDASQKGAKSSLRYTIN